MVFLYSSIHDSSDLLADMISFYTLQYHVTINTCWSYERLCLTWFQVAQNPVMQSPDMNAEGSEERKNIENIKPLALTLNFIIIFLNTPRSNLVYVNAEASCVFVWMLLSCLDMFLLYSRRLTMRLDFMDWYMYS